MYVDFSFVVVCHKLLPASWNVSLTVGPNAICLTKGVFVCQNENDSDDYDNRNDDGGDDDDNNGDDSERLTMCFD